MEKKPYRYKCKFCDEKSMTKAVMVKHIIKEHKLDIMSETDQYYNPKKFWKL